MGMAAQSTGRAARRAAQSTGVDDRTIYGQAPSMGLHQLRACTIYGHAPSAGCTIYGYHLLYHPWASSTGCTIHGHLLYHLRVSSTAPSMGIFYTESANRSQPDPWSVRDTSPSSTPALHRHQSFIPAHWRCLQMFARSPQSSMPPPLSMILGRSILK